MQSAEVTLPVIPEPPLDWRLPQYNPASFDTTSRFLVLRKIADSWLNKDYEVFSTWRDIALLAAANPDLIFTCHIAVDGTIGVNHRTRHTMGFDELDKLRTAK